MAGPRKGAAASTAAGVIGSTLAALALPQAGWRAWTDQNKDPYSIVLDTWVIDNRNNLNVTSQWNLNAVQAWLAGSGSGCIYGGQYEQREGFGVYWSDFYTCAKTTSGQTYCAWANLAAGGFYAEPVTFDMWRDQVYSSTSNWMGVIWLRGTPHNLGPWTLVGTHSSSAEAYQLSGANDAGVQPPATVQSTWDNFRYRSSDNAYGYSFGSSAKTEICGSDKCGHAWGDIRWYDLGYGSIY